MSLSAHSLVAEARGGSPAGSPLGQVEDTSTLASESQGIDVVLLVDKSASGDDQFRDVQHVAITLLGQLSPDDRVQLVGFDSRVDIVEPFTSDHARVEEAIGRMRARGSTSLYNALYVSLRQLAETMSDASPDARPQAIVLLSDGLDTSSRIGFDEVLELAKRSKVAIYSIQSKVASVTRTLPDFRRLPPSESDRLSRSGFLVLQQLAEETGGQAFLPGAARSNREEAALQVAKALATIQP